MRNFGILKYFAFGLMVPACGGSDGAKGDTGMSALIAVTNEPAGSNCDEGGQKVEYGADRDGNGKLSADEVEGTGAAVAGLGCHVALNLYCFQQ